MPLETAIQDQFEERRGVIGHVLLWIAARNRSTGLTETIGLSTYDDHREFTVSGQTRMYYGAGNVISVPPIRARVGLDVIYHSVTLAPFTPEVRIALRQYDPRQAPVELHTQAFDIDTGNPMGAPIRLVKGTIQEAPKSLGAKGSRDGKQVLKIASSARRLTLGVAAFKSDAAQQAQFPGDKGREYAAVAGSWVVPWRDE